MDYTIVMPGEANYEAGKISVLAPLGTALLGYRVADEIEWEVPRGVRRLRIDAVLFQPEAAMRGVAEGADAAQMLLSDGRSDLSR
jgi:regulator of nucleoside diphosphate kinase